MKPVFPLIALVLLLTGCASSPLLQSGRATSTDGVEAIDEALSQAGTPKPEESAAVPESVGEALMPGASAPKSQAPDEPRFDVSARELEAAAFFEGLFEDTGYNVMVHPSVEGKVSLQLQSVTLPEVMDLVEDLYGYDIQRQGRIYQVRPGGLRTRIFQINHLNMVRKGGSETRVSSGQVTATASGSGDNSDSGGGEAGGGGGDSTLIGTRITTKTESHFWRELRDALQMIIGTGEGRRVIITPGAGVVIVRANPDELRSAQDYLERTQLIMQRQVILEAKILEVALDEGYEQGVDWNAIEVNSRDVEGNPQEFLSGDLLGQEVTNPGLGGVFTAALSVNDFSTMIRLLGTQGNVQVLSSPRISTMNNQKAVIKVGTDEFFVTDIDFDEDDATAATGSETSTSVELTPFFSGISLDVTPQISEEGQITLHVHPSVSEVEDQSKIITIGERDVTLPLALSTVRETDSIVSARSGQIVVIGGLIQNQSEENNSAVPFFSDIPLVGEMFKQRNFSSRKSELVILLRPIVTGEGVFQEDMAETRQRVRALRSLLEDSDSTKPQPAAR